LRWPAAIHPFWGKFRLHRKIHDEEHDRLLFLHSIEHKKQSECSKMNETTAASTNMSTAPPANANSECVGPASEKAGKAAACEGCPNQGACASGSLNSPEALARAAQEVQQLKSSLAPISHTILVLSGKGGVGKSTVASQLALTLAHQGYAVGLLDVDLCGPSAPRMVLGDQASTQTIHKSASGLWTPVYAPNSNLAVVSISFLLQDRDQAVIWRGPRKNALIQQFLTEVDWTGETEGLDYLIVDTPPGTSDEHISTVQYLQKAGQIAGAVVVTTPEEASLADVRKELSFCLKTGVPVLGVIENMGTFETVLEKLRFTKFGLDCTDAVLQTLREKCPELLSEYTVSSDLFTVAAGGAAQMAANYGCPYWGSMPLDPDLLQACEQGQCFAEQHPTAKAAQALIGFCKQLSTVCHVDM
jgi:Mrp family chromosome partitioning ATPase